MQTTPKTCNLFNFS